MSLIPGAVMLVTAVLHFIAGDTTDGCQWGVLGLLWISVALHEREHRKARHVHTWETVDYGGAGWVATRCTTCGERGIE